MPCQRGFFAITSGAGSVGEREGERESEGGRGESERERERAREGERESEREESAAPLGSAPLRARTATGTGPAPPGPTRHGRAAPPGHNAADRRPGTRTAALAWWVPQPQPGPRFALKARPFKNFSSFFFFFSLLGFCFWENRMSWRPSLSCWL